MGAGAQVDQGHLSVPSPIFLNPSLFPDPLWLGLLPAPVRVSGGVEAIISALQCSTPIRSGDIEWFWLEETF